jgi:hypothetical protein
MSYFPFCRDDYNNGLYVVNWKQRDLGGDTRRRFDDSGSGFARLLLMMIGASFGVRPSSVEKQKNADW